MTVYKVGGDTRGVCTSPEDVLDKGVCKLGPVVREGLGERRQLGVFLGEVDDEFGQILGGKRRNCNSVQHTIIATVTDRAKSKKMRSKAMQSILKY